MSHYFFRLILLFNNKAFLLNCIMDFFSAASIGIAYISFSWHILSLYKNINILIIFMISWWVIGSLLSPITGYLIDKFSRRYIILGSHFSRIILIVLYLLFGSFSKVYNLYIFTTIWGLISAFFMPAALIFVRELFENDNFLMYSNSITNGIFEIGMILGIFVGSIFINLFLIHKILYFLLFFNIIAFFLSYKIHPLRIIKSHDLSFISNWIHVLRYIRANMFLFWYYLAQINFNCLFMTVPVFLSSYAKTILHATSFQFGLIEISFSIGFILGTCCMSFFVDKYHNDTKICIYALFISSLLYLILILLNSILLVVMCYFFIGFCISCYSILITISQRNTNIKLQGKVHSIIYGMSGILAVLLYSVLMLINCFWKVSSDKFFYLVVIITWITIYSLSKGYYKAIQEQIKI